MAHVQKQLGPVVGIAFFNAIATLHFEMGVHIFRAPNL